MANSRKHPRFERVAYQLAYGAETRARTSPNVHATARYCKTDRNWARGQAQLAGGIWFSNPSPSAPPSALTPVAVQLRLVVVGAMRAMPRSIHGVRFATTATARSDRRIALRGPGVGVDASSASAEPACAP